MNLIRGTEDHFAHPFDQVLARRRICRRAGTAKELQAVDWLAEQAPPEADARLVDGCSPHDGNPPG